MKKLTKRALALMLAIIMATPMMFALPQAASANGPAATGSNIFHWTFDNGSEWKEELTGNQFSIAQSWSDPNYQQFSDHIWLRDGWMYAAVPTSMSQTRNNKCWRIDLSFSMANSGLAANRLEHVLGITAKSNVSSSYDGGESFGMSTDGRVYLNTTHYSQPIGDTGVNLKDYFFGAGNEDNTKPMKLSYVYDHGIISVLINDEVRFSYDAGDAKSTFENIKYVTLGGRRDVGNWMDIFDLAAYPTGNAESYPDKHLVAHYFADYDRGDLTYDFSGNNKTLQKMGEGATWQDCGGTMAAQFTGSTSSKDYFRIAASTVLSNVNFNEGFTVTFKAKPNTHASSGWVRYIEISESGIASSDSEGNGKKYFFITPSDSGKAKANKTTSSSKSETGSPSINDTDTNWHSFAFSVFNGYFMVYKDGVLMTDCQKDSAINDTWFNALKNGYFMIGAATFPGDPIYDGAMRDVKIYDKALSAHQIKDEANNVVTDNVNVKVKGKIDFRNTANGYTNSSDTITAGDGSGIQVYSKSFTSSNYDFDHTTKTSYDDLFGDNKHLVYTDNSSRTAGAFQDNSDFRISFHMGVKASEGAETLVIFKNRSGGEPIKMKRSGVIVINGNNASGYVENTTGESISKDYDFQFDYRAQKLIVRTIRDRYEEDATYEYYLPDYGLTLNPGDLSSVQVGYDGSKTQTRFVELTVYEPTVSYDDSLVLSKQAMALRSAILSYESKMNSIDSQSNTIFKKTKPAYDAYVLANRYYDAIICGETASLSPQTVASATNDLISKTNAMTSFNYRTFSVPSGTDTKWASHDLHGVSGDINSVYHNVVWSSGISAGNPGENDYTSAVAIGYEEKTYSSTSWGIESKNSIRPVIYRESAVLVHTGISNDDPLLPVMFRARCWRGNSGNFSQRHRAAYIDSNAQGMTLNANWHGTDSELNVLYTLFNHGVTNVRYTNNSSTYNEVSASGSGYKKWFYANVMKFDQSKNSFGNNEYSKTVNGITWGFIYSNNNDTSNKTQTVAEGMGAKQNDYNSTNSPIYVLNYAPLLSSSRLPAYESAFKGMNVTDYKQGGLTSFLTALDKATDANPQNGGYDFSSDTATKVANCANAISSAVSALDNNSNKLASATADNTDYNSLRSAMLDAHSSYTLDGSVRNTSAKNDYHHLDGSEFTPSSVSNFRAKYENAKAHMAALASSSYGHSTSGAVATVLSQLQEAHHNLDQRADFTALDAAKSAAISQKTDNDLTSKYTASSINGADAYFNSADEFPIENTNDRANVGVSQNAAISAEITKYCNWKNDYDGFDPLADLTYFDAEFDKANTFLLGLDDKAAEYEAQSIQELIDSVTSASVSTAQGGTDITAGEFASSDTQDRADYGTAVQSDVNTLADGIRDAMAGLKKIEAVVSSVPAADISAFEAAVTKLNNIDPDAYDVESGDIESVRRSANTVLSSAETQKSYAGATINVLNDGITQQDIEDATNRILSNLTVNTKKYVITTEGETGELTCNNGSLDSEHKAPYGTTVKCDSGDEETAWYLEIRTGSMYKALAFQGYGQRFQTKVLGTTRIKAVKKAPMQKSIKIVRKYGDNAVTDKSPVMFVDYVAAGSTFTFEAAPAIAFYEFDKYYIGENEYEATDEITINDDTVIIAKYNVKPGADCAINARNISDIGNNSTVSYNTKVTLDGGEGAYAWVEAIDATHYRPFYIGRNLEFFASESITLKAVSKADFDAYKFTLPCVNLRKGGIIESEGKKVFNAQLVNDGKDIQEYGILIAVPYGSTPIPMENLLSSMVTIENSGSHDGENGYNILRAKSTRLVGANQFAISVKSLPSQYIYRGYVIYKDSNGNLRTVYSEAM